MFLAFAKTTLEFEALRLGQLQHFCFSHKIIEREIQMFVLYKLILFTYLIVKMERKQRVQPHKMNKIHLKHPF